MASTHRDVVHEFLVESLATAALRQELIHHIGKNLLNPSSSVGDSNIIAVTQLIASGLIGREETAYHEAGLETMIKQRGGLDQFDRVLASMISWIALESAILNEAKPRVIYHRYSTLISSKAYPPTATIPESPLYCPHGQYITLPRSVVCKREALDILGDVRMLIDVFIHEVSLRAPTTFLKFYAN